MVQFVREPKVEIRWDRDCFPLSEISLKVTLFPEQAILIYCIVLCYIMLSILYMGRTKVLTYWTVLVLRRFAE